MSFRILFVGIAMSTLIQFATMVHKYWMENVRAKLHSESSLLNDRLLLMRGESFLREDRASDALRDSTSILMIPMVSSEKSDPIDSPNPHVSRTSLNGGGQGGIAKKSDIIDLL